MEQYSIDLTCRLMFKFKQRCSSPQPPPWKAKSLTTQIFTFLSHYTNGSCISSTAPSSVPEALAWPWKSSITSDNALVLIVFILSGLMCWAVILDLTLVTMSLMSSMTLSAYFSSRYTRIYKLRPNNSRLDSGTSVCFNAGTTCLCFCPKPCLDK